MIDAAGARPPTGTAGHDTEAMRLSLTVIGEKIRTEPELVTTNE